MMACGSAAPARQQALSTGVEIGNKKANPMKSLFFLCILGWVTQACAQSVTESAFAKWEPEIVRLEEAGQTQTPEDGAVVFYGSSSIRLWDGIGQDMAPWPVVQRGFGGASLPDIIYFAPRILGPHLGRENPRRCRAVVLFVANDIVGNQETDAPAADVAARFEQLLRWIREQDDSVPVFWIEVTPTRSRWSAWPEIRNATTRIRTVAESDPAAFTIPTAGAFLGADGQPVPDFFGDDQLHLSPAGYQIWSALIKANLDAALGPAIAEQKEMKPNSR